MSAAVNLAADWVDSLCISFSIRLSAIPLPAHWDDDPTDSLLVRLDGTNSRHAAELEEVTREFLLSSAYPTGVPRIVTGVQRIQVRALRRRSHATTRSHGPLDIHSVTRKHMDCVRVRPLFDV
jgi:hypothetical protein